MKVFQMTALPLERRHLHACLGELHCGPAAASAGSHDDRHNSSPSKLPHNARSTISVSLPSLRPLRASLTDVMLRVVALRKTAFI